jgi:hypothetical protein
MLTGIPSPTVIRKPASMRRTKWSCEGACIVC